MCMSAPDVCDPLSNEYVYVGARCTWVLELSQRAFCPPDTWLDKCRGHGPKDIAIEGAAVAVKHTVTPLHGTPSPTLCLVLMPALYIHQSLSPS